MNAHLPRIQRILDKLSQARTRGLTCLGADSHQFRLAALLSEEALRRFEATHGIVLPEDYRAFLLHAGNGGAGPYYGIFPLEKWDDFARTVLPEVPQGYLTCASPLVAGRNHALTFEDDAQVRFAHQGTLSLGSQGCTYGMQLIVSGPSRGRVAYVDADQGTVPFVTRDVDFLAWYERWLDELLEGHETFWFGFSPPGGETELLEQLENTQLNPEIRVEAVSALLRRPHLSAATLERWAAHLDDPVPAIRAAACTAVGRSGPDSALAQVADRLEDPDAQVRGAAAKALLAREPARWAPAVLAVMRQEGDPAVAVRLLHAQLKAGQLDNTALLALVQTACLDDLRAAAVYGLNWLALTAEHRDHAVRLLSDHDRQVRIYAAGGLRDCGLPLPVSVVTACLERESDPEIIGPLLDLLKRLADPAAADTLLQWAARGDDFHALSAVAGLLRLGDLRVLPRVARMLMERRPPRRGVMSSLHPIRLLAWRALKREAPRGFARRIGLTYCAGQQS